MATPRHMLRSRRVALWALWAVAASLLQIAAATTSTTPAASTLSKNMKKLLERVDPNEMADGVARFVFCSSHHYKGLVSGVTPFLVEWSSCTNRHPTDSTEGHIACFLRSTNIISFGINLGQQINNFMGCLLSSNSSSVLCSKKVQKVEDCSNMCPDSRYPNMEAASISSPALSVTVRKDDCKLSPRLASNATLSSLNASLDYSMKLIQCFPIHFGDTYQQMMNHVKVINQCTASRAENWGAWAQCLYDEHDVKLVAPYFVKVRLTIACIVGGDVPAQTFCVRSMKSAEDCRSCGGQDSASILDPVSALGATNTCSV